MPAACAPSSTATIGALTTASLFLLLVSSSGCAASRVAGNDRRVVVTGRSASAEEGDGVRLSWPLTSVKARVHVDGPDGGSISAHLTQLAPVRGRHDPPGGRDQTTRWTALVDGRVVRSFSLHPGRGTYPLAE